MGWFGFGGLRVVIALSLISCLAVSATGQNSIPDSSNRRFIKLAQTNGVSDAPNTQYRIHRAGNFQMTMTNWGEFGNVYSSLVDPETGLPAPGMQYPAGSNCDYLNWGELWAGAVFGSGSTADTLVTQWEWLPGAEDMDFLELSNEPNSPHFDPAAIATEELICQYADTIMDQEYVLPDYYTLRPHKPIGIGIRQHSYVWSYDYLEDVIIVQYSLTNLRNIPISNLWLGLWIYPRVLNRMSTKALAGKENLVGFMRTAPVSTGGDFADTIMAAWWADNDGDLYHQGFWEQSVRSVIGVRVLGLGQDQCFSATPVPNYSFNWWSYFWGPQKLPGDRSIIGKLGGPYGDAQRYRYLSNREIDYDQYLANDDSTESGWIPPFGIRDIKEGEVYNIADGHDVCILYSIGPLELEPGETIPFTVAFAGGELFHRDAGNRKNLSKNPNEWFKNVDFSDLTRNLQWASRVYDNPGIDTDGDGCSGRKYGVNCRREDNVCFEKCFEDGDSVFCYDVCFDNYEVCDSFYYVGDGIPDLRTPPPPPSPEIKISTEPYTVRITWSGKVCEPFFDPFSQTRDFEGYSVYSGIGSDVNSLNLVCSWDVVNYDRYRFIPTARPSPWVCNEPPFTLEQLQSMLGADFIPEEYPDRNSVYTDDSGEQFYFVPHGGNRGNEYVEYGRVVDNPIQYVRTDSLWDDDSQSWQLFGHYECVIDNLLPSQPYYFAVTAFDQGYAAGDLGPLESPPQSNLQLAYPSYSPEYVQENRLNVSVYTNPYKIDADYRGRGYEDPNHEGFKERVRRIHFVNLPPKATIKIFSLDGDLIRELHHPESRFSDTPSHTAWDLITRNTQAITSGIYLYSIESDWGNQVGKIVVIK